MIIPFFARDTTHGCPQENPYCLSTRSNDDNSTTTSTTTTHTHPKLGHTNLVGVLVIASLLALALVLSLCFAKWSKPLRRFLRGEPRPDDSERTSTDGGGGGGSLAAPTTLTAPSSTKASRQQQGDTDDDDDDDDAEKANVVPNSNSSSSSSSQSSLDQDTIKENASVEIALPAKVSPESASRRALARPGAGKTIETITN
jgi:hypothetical protein